MEIWRFAFSGEVLVVPRSHDPAQWRHGPNTSAHRRSGSRSGSSPAATRSAIHCRAALADVVVEGGDRRFVVVEERGTTHGEQKRGQVGVGDHPVDVGADLGGDAGAGGPGAQQSGEARLLGLADAVEIEAGGDLFLRPEVVVDAAGARPCFLPDVGEGGLVVAEGGKALEGGVEDRLTPATGRLGAGTRLGGRGELAHDVVDTTSNVTPSDG